MVQEVLSGVFRFSDEDNFLERKEELREMVSKLADEQRVRLNEQYPDRQWWADAVFFMRDIKSVCQILDSNGQEDVSHLLAEICAKTAVAMFQAYLGKSTEPNDPRIVGFRDELMKEGEILEGVMSAAVAKFSGQGVQ